MFERMRRLYPRGTANAGIAVDAEGATLGPDCVLVRRTAGGYRSVSRDEAAALQEFLFGDSQPRLSREEAIGNRVDYMVRFDLRGMFNSLGIPYGPGGDITINNRDYETTDNASQYRVPDARLGDVAFDWMLSSKTIGSAQIRGFFRADSQPRAVIIVRPSALGPVRTYLLPRPDDGSL